MAGERRRLGRCIAGSPGLTTAGPAQRLQLGGHKSRAGPGWLVTSQHWHGMEPGIHTRGVPRWQLKRASSSYLESHLDSLREKERMNVNGI